MRAVCVVRIRSKVRDDAADCMILPSQVWGLWAFLLTVGRNSQQRSYSCVPFIRGGECETAHSHSCTVPVGQTCSAYGWSSKALPWWRRRSYLPPAPVQRCQNSCVSSGPSASKRLRQRKRHAANPWYSSTACLRQSRRGLELVKRYHLLHVWLQGLKQAKDVAGSPARIYL